MNAIVGYMDLPEFFSPLNGLILCKKILVFGYDNDTADKIASKLVQMLVKAGLLDKEVARVYFRDT